MKIFWTVLLLYPDSRPPPLGPDTYTYVGEAETAAAAVAAAQEKALGDNPGQPWKATDFALLACVPGDQWLYSGDNDASDQPPAEYDLVIDGAIKEFYKKNPGWIPS